MAKETIVLGGGCFWCVEAVFAELKGVEKVESGYAGGETPNPTYEQVCSGRTGHAEVVQVTFDPAVLSLRDLLGIFFTMHDPTTLNRQGADEGTEYRSIILYASPEQRETAQGVMEEVAAQGVWDDPIVTELAPLERFYPAEEYHEDYYRRHPEQAYCRIVIEPKVAKLRQAYRENLAKAA